MLRATARVHNRSYVEISDIVDTALSRHPSSDITYSWFAAATAVAAAIAVGGGGRCRVVRAIIIYSNVFVVCNEPD